MASKPLPCRTSWFESCYYGAHRKRAFPSRERTEKFRTDESDMNWFGKKPFSSPDRSLETQYSLDRQLRLPSIGFLESEPCGISAPREDHITARLCGKVMDQHSEIRRSQSFLVTIEGRDANGRCFKQKALASGISRSGALLSGITRHVRPGDVISVEQKGRKSRKSCGSEIPNHINSSKWPYTY